MKTEKPLPIFRSDPWLTPYSVKILKRVAKTERREKTLLSAGHSLADFASAHEFFGLHKTSDGWILRERAPNAVKIELIGDMNEWKGGATFSFTRTTYDTWELQLPSSALAHEQLYKLRVYWNENGSVQNAERIPSHVRRVVQDLTTNIFSAQIWEPSTSYQWKFHFSVPQTAPLIYEAHVGMAQEEGRVGSYNEFTDLMLPRIAAAGYNTVQLMAIQEHPYYGSFGYQVSSFFAASSRFGTPEELKRLVDTAHGLGLAVIMDLVHSHAVKNELEGLSRFDGSYDLYFHSDPTRSEHPAWKTRCFDYGKNQTLHFLLSNCRYWLDTFHFDGFRFDGITSMLYYNHGLGTDFNSYNQYFDGNLDVDAIIYLSLANKLIHQVRPDALTVAEDMSGMPGLAAPIEQGGIGFDYRLAMGTPDYWIKIIKDQRDEDWNVATIWSELTNRRADEKTISYAESHDQALVGDQTLIFRLANNEMYTSMGKWVQSVKVDRALAMHKLIRLITLATAGNGYLNFMGNEFGHPEWIDFPREGNGWSYQFARRQWSLEKNPELKYHGLSLFDKALIELAKEYSILENPHLNKIYEHVEDHLLAFERAGLLFIFNIHPHDSFVNVPIKVSRKQYNLLLSSDDARFEGQGRVTSELPYIADSQNTMQFYLPARVGLVFG